MTKRHFVRLARLNGFSRPLDGAILLDSTDAQIGRFDFSWSSDLLFRCNSGRTLRSDSWLGLLEQITQTFGCE